ncbi:MAG: hypothetical protein KIT84_01455 [Labilithrix sp.]|nr:hypothetical protein [Labilithrix sp.]MCW5809653.1 hypothetical protein [Labilithrix sp.]
MRLARLALVATFTLGAGACASLLGLDPLEAGDLPDDAGGDDAPAIEGDATAAGDGGTVGEAGVAPCDPNEDPPANAVYVSAAPIEAGARDGTAAAPYATITAARAAAKASAGPTATLVVDHGTYIEALVLERWSRDVVIDGGWTWSEGTWKRDCATDAKDKTILRSTTDRGVLIHDNTAIVTLTSMTIESRPTGTTAANTNGASRYGVFVLDSIVRLTGVTVRAHAGDAAGTASDGTDAVTARCITAPGPACAGGDAGANKQAPPTPTYGTLTANGLAHPSALGEAGGAGENGTPGQLGGSRSDCWSGCNNHLGTPPCGTQNLTTVTSPRGECGCGGMGGGPGQPGRGGGGSFALYAVGDATLVDAFYTDLTAGNGGAGSTGGRGGAGAAGTAGKAGTPATCWPNQCCTVGTCPECGCYGPPDWVTQCGTQPTPSPVLPAGTAGGSGGNGGKGADGMNGPGGPSFTYILIGGAQVRFTETARTFGASGPGAAGAPNGPAGERP